MAAQGRVNAFQPTEPKSVFVVSLDQIRVGVACHPRREELVFSQDAVDVVPDRRDDRGVLPLKVHVRVVVDEPDKGQKVGQEFFVVVLIHQ